MNAVQLDLPLFVHSDPWAHGYVIGAGRYPIDVETPFPPGSDDYYQFRLGVYAAWESQLETAGHSNTGRCLMGENRSPAEGQR